ncbi:MFS transporter [Aquabacterium humicola]|uniref:MFS transporter n=1 Tax=Aquabacterium humicola TaxID=3237377 RepID=UPI0025435CBD|nr:MFS transporter [Rubrivivax pictus]
MDRRAWLVTLAAAALMALASGLRASGGLFVSPLNSASGLGLATISLLFATGQLALGLAQPVIGAWADRHGSARVVAGGALVLALGTALLALPGAGLAPGAALAALAVALCAAAMANGAVGGNALLVGELNRRLPAAHAGVAVGVLSAGASIGQLLVAPATQALIETRGFVPAALASAALALCALPLAAVLRRPAGSSDVAPAAPLGDALRDARFLRVAASFGICGFHVSFLAVHMPGVIERCGQDAALAGAWIAVAGVANVAGSLAVGRAMPHVDIARLLAALYAVRAAGIAAFLCAAPSRTSLVALALVMGASHMATLPPTAQLVARQHGVARLSSLLGIVMLVHQVGGFGGIWLSGWLAERTGRDTPFWMVDIALALAAAALVWPLRARRVSSQPAGCAASRRGVGEVQTSARTAADANS